MNGTFYEQLGCVAGMFEQWGTCERTVIACALAKRVPWPGLRLVQRTVEAALQSRVEDERLERDANDDTHVASLLAAAAARPDDDDEEERLRQLLTLLPLLRTDNERTKCVYVSAVPALVQRCVDAPRRCAPDLCRQLLSYMLVHPALTVHDHTTLTQWLRFLENHMSGNRTTEAVWQQKIEPCLFSHSNIWGENNSFRRTIGKNIEFKGLLDSIEQSIYSDILQESFSKNGRDVDLSLEGDMLSFDPAIIQPKSQRSNSLTPPSTNMMHMSSSAENLNDESFVQKPRSFSLSSEHSLGQLRPMIMYGTTGSETRLDDLRLNNFTEHPGMSTVGQWLKSLRLHKYVWLFTNISYEQMMAIDDDYLEKLGVTKGARHKILLSIRKLHERGAVLDAIRAELRAAGVAGGGAAGGGVGGVARALERLRGVLLSPMPPSSDLPAAVVEALELASACLGGAGVGAEDPEVDPMSLHCWLVEKALHHSSFRGAETQAALRRLRHRLPPRQFFSHVSDMPLRRHTKPRWRGPQYPTRQVKRWVGRGKSHSYPPFPPVPPGAVLPGGAPPPGPVDYSGLDALCLQMTEQAIN